VRRAPGHARSLLLVNPTMASGRVSFVWHVGVNISPDPARLRRATPLEGGENTGRWKITGLDQLLQVRFRDRFRFAVYLQLGIDVFDVGFRSLFADEQLFGDLRVRLTFGDQLKDLRFAFGEWRVGIHVEVVYDHTGDTTAHGGSAFHDLIERAQQFHVVGAFGDVAAGAGFEGLEDKLAVFIDRHHNDVGVGAFIFNDLGAVDTVHTGKLDVHEHDLGFVAVQISDGVFGRAVGVHYHKLLGAVHDQGEAVADLLVVLHDHHAFFKRQAHISVF